MIRWIVGTSLRYRYVVVAGAVAMVVFGAAQIRDAKVDVFPEFAPPRVEVQTAAIGLTTTDIEGLVTVPLEQALSGVEGLDEIRSKSVPDLSSIEMIFKPRTDLLYARKVVQERIQSVSPNLPTWSGAPTIMPAKSATSRIMKVGLSSKDISMTEMSSIAYWTMRSRILRVPGVAQVAIWGERIQQLHVQADPVRMRAQNVSLDELMQATADSLDAGLLRFSGGALIGTGGFIETPNQSVSVRHVPGVTTPEQLAVIPIKRAPDGRPILIRDVASVVEGHQPLIGDAVINGGPGLMLIVEKTPWGNTLEVTRGVEAAIEEMRPGLPGLEIDTTIFRPATFIEESVDNLSEALWLGAVLMAVVLVLFLFSVRSALISVVTIPLSIMGTLLVLTLTGTTINTMILAGLVIALGAIVDDAIVDTENIVRRLRQHRAEGDTSDRSTMRVIFDASIEVRGAIVYASLIEAMALLPILTLQGLTGSFFRPLGFTYALAVIVSMTVALTVTPALTLIFFSRGRLQERESPIVRWLQRAYTRVLSGIMRAPRFVYATVTLIAVVGIAVATSLGQTLLPEFKERDFLMHWVAKPGTSQPEIVRTAERASDELMAVPGVRNFGAHIGQAFLADEVVGINFAENWVSVDPSADYDATLADIQAVVDGYPGLYRDVQTYLKERIREVLTGSGEAIVVRIYGDDLDVLRSKAERIKDKLSGIDGVVEEHVELQEEVPQVKVEVDLAAAQRVGLKPGDVRRATATIMTGEEVGDFFVGGKAFDVHVWSTPETRASLTNVLEMPIDTPSGGRVLLRDVAQVRVLPTPNEIHREGASRVIDVGANVRGRDLGSVAGEIQETLDDVSFPLGHRAELLGEYKERQAADRRLLVFAVVAALGIFLLLLMSFHSLRLAILSFVTLPMALVGGAIAVSITGGTISLGSLVGFFTILGVVARNGIMQISHYQHLQEHEGEAFGMPMVLRGSRERLSPILMTALTTAMALMPLLLAGEIPGQEIEYPMAVVILGGLVTSTLLNLFVVPSLYLRFGQRKDVVNHA